MKICTLHFPTTGGDPKDTEIVLVQRRPFRHGAWFEVPVTKNLAAGLRELRARLSHNEAYYVWTDAICINQTNIPERNYQVGIMYDIFAASHTTVGWLGELTAEIDQSLSWLIGLYTWKERPVDIEHTVRQHIFDYTNIEPIDIQSHTEGLNAITKILEVLAGLSALMEIPYWRRGWVFQELVAKSSPHFLCGHRMIPGLAIWTLFPFVDYL